VDEPSGEAQIRDEQMVKALCFDLLPRESIFAHLERIRQHHAWKLAEHEELLARHEAGSEEGPRHGYRFRLGPHLTLRRGMIAARGYVEWCDEALALMARWAG
jgi:hypothetical protein